jgi:opacity protein-like surface antigen
MRKMTLTLAAAGAAVAFAAPASAQYYPAPNYVPAYQQGYGYQQPGYGHNNWLFNFRDQRYARMMQDRVQRYARSGVSISEARRIDNRVRRLETRVMREANDWNRRPGVRRYNAWNYDQYQNYYGRDGYRDRDRDGRNDRYEDDRGRDRDD